MYNVSMDYFDPVIIADKKNLQYIKSINDAADRPFMSDAGELSFGDFAEYVDRLLSDLEYKIKSFPRENEKQFKAQIDDIDEVYKRLNELQISEPQNEGQVVSLLKEIIKFKDNVDNLYKSVDERNDYRKLGNLSIDTIDSLEETDETKKLKLDIQNSISDDFIDIDKLKECVARVNELATQKWQEEITDVKDFENGKSFKFLAHNLSGGRFEKGKDKFWATELASASLITDKTMGLYKSEDGYRVGFLFAPKGIVAASRQDLYTFNNRNAEEAFQMKGTPEIATPDAIEKHCVNVTKEQNGEELNYDNATIFSEIALEEIIPVGVFCITNGEKDLNPSYIEAKRLADEFGFDEPVDIDISLYREKLGLAPMNERDKKNMARDFARFYTSEMEKERQMDADDAMQFQDIRENMTKRYSELISERFLSLKKSGLYSKEALRQIVNEDIIKDISTSSDISDIRQHYGAKTFKVSFDGIMIAFKGNEDMQKIVSSRYDFTKMEEEQDEVIVSRIKEMVKLYDSGKRWDEKDSRNVYVEEIEKVKPDIEKISQIIKDAGLECIDDKKIAEVIRSGNGEVKGIFDLITDKYSRQVASNNHQINNLENEIEEKESKLAMQEYKDKVLSKKSEYEYFETQMSLVKNDITFNNDRITILNNRQTGLLSEKQSKEQEKQKYEKKSMLLQKTIYRNKISKLSKNIQELQASISDIQKSKDSLYEQVNALKQQTKEIESDFDDKVKDIGLSSQTYSDDYRMVSQMEDVDINSIKAEVTKIQSQIEEIRRDDSYKKVKEYEEKYGYKAKEYEYKEKEIDSKNISIE